jgi:hypothetical protein
MARKSEVIPLVVVRWLDAYIVQDCVDYEGLKSGCLQETYGRVVKETDEAISVAHEISLDDVGGRHITTIPKPYITDIMRFECKVKNVLPKDNKGKGRKDREADSPAAEGTQSE